MAIIKKNHLNPNLNWLLWPRSRPKWSTAAWSSGRDGRADEIDGRLAAWSSGRDGRVVAERSTAWPSAVTWSDL